MVVVFVQAPDGKQFLGTPLLTTTPENPLFIETLPRRGYRFIAPVSKAPEHQATGPTDAIAEALAGGGNREVAREVVAGSAEPVRSSPALASSRAWPGSRSLLLFAAAAVAILAVVAYLIHPRLSSNSGAQKRVMLAILPFQNLSNDPTQEYFSDGLTEETITDLGSSLSISYPDIP